MLTPNLFKSLTHRQQGDLLYRKGTYMHTAEEPEFIIDLYTLQDFYVELYYHKWKNRLVIVRSYYSKDSYQPEEAAQNYYRTHYLGNHKVSA